MSEHFKTSERMKSAESQTLLVHGVRLSTVLLLLSLSLSPEFNHRGTRL
jgi:hypothetical protein